MDCHLLHSTSTKSNAHLTHRHPHGNIRMSDPTPRRRGLAMLPGRVGSHPRLHRTRHAFPELELQTCRSCTSYMGHGLQSFPGRSENRSLSPAEAATGSPAARSPLSWGLTTLCDPPRSRGWKGSASALRPPPGDKAGEALLSLLERAGDSERKLGSQAPTAPDPDARVSLPFRSCCLWEAAFLLNFCSEIICTLWVSQEHPRESGLGNKVTLFGPSLWTYRLRDLGGKFPHLLTPCLLIIHLG